MILQPAVFHDDVCSIGQKCQAYWIKTTDNIRLRIGVWGHDTANHGAIKGTILLFPGRTEYIEKYADAAHQFLERGYGTVAIDWRGQGLADRLHDDPQLGHVEKFTDYQQDVAALMQAVDALELPRPFYLLGHSMGGAIGLQALMQGLEVKAAAFSAPMWGIQLAPHLRALAFVTTRLMPLIGLGHKIPPGTTRDSYVLAAPYEDNMLTRDRGMYEMMQNQTRTHPAFGLGAPSYIWLGEALSETRKMRQMASPAIPALTILGSNERIVDTGAIHERMAHWPGSTLREVQGAEHEILMEDETTRNTAYDEITALFSDHP